MPQTQCARPQAPTPHLACAVLCAFSLRRQSDRMAMRLRVLRNELVDTIGEEQQGEGRLAAAVAVLRHMEDEEAGVLRRCGVRGACCAGAGCGVRAAQVRGVGCVLRWCGVRGACCAGAGCGVRAVQVRGVGCVLRRCGVRGECCAGAGCGMWGAGCRVRGACCAGAGCGVQVQGAGCVLRRCVLRDVGCGWRAWWCAGVGQGGAGGDRKRI